MHPAVIHNEPTSDSFEVKTGVRQGCMPYPLLFNIVVDSIMIEAHKNTRGLQTTLTNHLTHLDYADDVCLLAQSYSKGL